MNDQTEYLADFAIAIERGAKLRERLAILEIIIEELKHANNQDELDVLDRVAASIKHRTHEGL